MRTAFADHIGSSPQHIVDGCVFVEANSIDFESWDVPESDLEAVCDALNKIRSQA